MIEVLEDFLHAQYQEKDEALVLNVNGPGAMGTAYERSLSPIK